VSVLSRSFLGHTSDFFASGLLIDINPRRFDDPVSENGLSYKYPYGICNLCKKMRRKTVGIPEYKTKLLGFNLSHSTVNCSRTVKLWIHLKSLTSFPLTEIVTPVNEGSMCNTDICSYVGMEGAVIRVMHSTFRVYIPKYNESDS
jgi:hypothetical protein